jgi:hypothetical protein
MDKDSCYDNLYDDPTLGGNKGKTKWAWCKTCLAYYKNTFPQKGCDGHDIKCHRPKTIKYAEVTHG